VTFTEQDLGSIMHMINAPITPKKRTPEGYTMRGSPVKLVLLGTGKNMEDLFLKLKSPGLYMSSGVGFEVLSTSMACKTYNILVDEGRNVIAAMIPAGS